MTICLIQLAVSLSTDHTTLPRKSEVEAPPTGAVIEFFKSLNYEMAASRVEAEEGEMMVGKRLKRGELWQPGNSILA